MRDATPLVLFDIDGTLLRRAGPHHRQVLEDAVLRVAGVRASTDGVPVAGMLDRDILVQMMGASGLSRAAARRHLPEIMACAQRLYARRCPPLADRVCPGVPALLAHLTAAGAVLGLVTGNLSRIGWKKMERAGLKRHFRLGAFAEQGSTRGALVRLAVAEARRNGWIGKGSPITMVGDHPNDIAAARHARVRSLAVGTGVVAEAELALHNPDLLVPDLSRLDPRWLLAVPATPAADALK